MKRFVLGVGSVLLLCTAATNATAQSVTGWLEYHGPAGAGYSSALTSVNTSTPAWMSPPLNGTIYAAPLVYGANVYVATEGDNIYALNASTGAVVWSVNVGTPVPSSQLPCGNISPSVGITGTPVVDPARNELFVVADLLKNGAPAHFLIGVNTTNGAIQLDVPVNPPGTNQANYLQRTGLALDAGRVIFGEAGNDGDCASYRGRVFSVSEDGYSTKIFTVDNRPGLSQGGVWMGGAAPIVDAQGNVWVATGNGSVHTTGQRYDDSDGLLKLSPKMKLLQYYAPVAWAIQNGADLDMSSGPTLLANGLVLAAGKSANIYVERASTLTGIGGELATAAKTCPGMIDGGSAVEGDLAILPCVTGPEAVQVTTSPVRVTPLWQATNGGGPPIIAANEVWSVSRTGVLYGLSLTNGSVVQSATIGPVANHFTTPAVGDGELVVATSNQVVAFAGTSS